MSPIEFNNPMDEYYTPWGRPKQEYISINIGFGMIMTLPLENRKPDDIIELENGRLIMPNLNLF